MPSKNLPPIVYVIDDEKKVAEALAWLIKSVGYKVAVHNSAKSFLEDYQANQIGCLVVDVRMPEISGLEFQEILIARKINLPLILISGHGDIPMAVRAIKNGAVEFLTKPINNQLLLDTINKALKQHAESQQANEITSEIKLRVNELTQREREVMVLMVAGKMTKVIADELEISPHTAELHRSRVMKKMKVKSLAELVNLTITNDLI